MNKSKKPEVERKVNRSWNKPALGKPPINIYPTKSSQCQHYNVTQIEHYNVVPK